MFSMAIRFDKPTSKKIHNNFLFINIPSKSCGITEVKCYLTRYRTLDRLFHLSPTLFKWITTKEKSNISFSFQCQVFCPKKILTWLGIFIFFHYLNFSSTLRNFLKLFSFHKAIIFFKICLGVFGGFKTTIKIP